MTDVDVQVFLEHHGIKGMRWGVRKEHESTNDSKNTNAKSNRNRNAAAILGSVAVAGALAAGAIYAKKHFGTSISDIPKSTSHAKTFADAIAKEPVGLMHVARGRDRGYMVLRSGGLKDPESEMLKAGLDHARHGYFKKYGSAGAEKVAVAFADPHGRKDFAGRIIEHHVIFPAKTGKHLYNFDQAVEEAWPMIKDISGALYEGRKGAYGPGF